jgi:hypothetical protein
MGGLDMSTHGKTKDKENEKLFNTVLRFNVRAIGLGLGLVSGLALFVATNWLVIKGGPFVGVHLSLLSQFFPGYRVSFLGSFIGLAYGFALGSLVGSLISWIYNRLDRLRSKI